VTRTLVAPGQLDLFAPPPPQVPRCLYRSETRGLVARLVEFEAWQECHGSFGSLVESHAWTPPACAPMESTSRCQPTELSADLRPHTWKANPVPPPCGCWDIDELMYRGACTGCAWEGPPVTSHNLAVEDACGHAHPGWWDLPTVPRVPEGISGDSATARKRINGWLAKVRAVYPAGWLEAGGPIRTLRYRDESRHVEKATPFGGYDLAVVKAGAAQ